LRSLPLAAFEALPPLEQALVRLYYGIGNAPDELPLTQRELAARFRLGSSDVASRVRRAVEQLLDPRHPSVAEHESETTPWQGDGLTLPTLRRPRASDVARLRALPRALVETLPDDDRTIVALYYGLHGHAPRSRASIARQYGITPGRVAAVVTRSIERLLGRDADAVLGDRADDFRREPSGAEGALLACAVCGEPVRVPRSAAYRRRHVTCSEACRQEDRRWQRQPVLLPCAVCGTVVSRSAARARESTRQVCSQACLRDLRRQRCLERPPNTPETRAKQLATRRRRLEDPTLAPQLHARLRAARAGAAGR
jgi:hypothetical protein